MLKDKRVALYVTGGIAVYKSVFLMRELIKAGAIVKVVMTKGAQEFVTPLTFETLSQNTVYTDVFMKPKPGQVAHIHLADWTDLAIVAPATANMIGKIANGIADDFATTALLATTAPKLVVPAMNEHMWDNPATKRNVQQLKKDNLTVLEPATGFLAEGYEGKGRFPEIEQIMGQAFKLLTPQLLTGKQVVITAGGTSEPLDPVRYLTNRSSGKMGYAFAKAAVEMGADVTLISATNHLPAPVGLDKLIYVQTAKQMQGAVETLFKESDIVIMAAAVSDFRPQEYVTQKIKKQADQSDLVLPLTKNPDILAGLGKVKQQQFLIGFAAETQDLLKYAKEKLKKKNVDLLVANDVSKNDRGFNANNNAVTLLWRDGKQEVLPLATKDMIAKTILEKIKFN